MKKSKRDKMAEVRVGNDLYISITKVVAALKNQLKEIPNILFTEHRSQVVSISRISHISKGVTASFRIPLPPCTISLIGTAQILVEDPGLILLLGPHTDISGLTGVKSGDRLVSTDLVWRFSSPSAITIYDIIQLRISIKPYTLFFNRFFE